MISTKERKKNIRLYPIYKMISWDLLFYYSIIFLFLTQVKQISPADVLLGEAFYPVAKFILLMPLTALIAKIGKRKSLIIANFVNALSILSYLVAKDLKFVLIGQFFSGIAFDIKGVAESNLLYDNLLANRRRGDLFSKIDGKATSWYYYMDAITAIASGFLYIINGYIPLILCLVGCIISMILSFQFKDTGKQKQTIHTRKYMKDLGHSFRYMIQSKRLKYLLLFGSTFAGFLSVLVSLRSGILQEIGMPEQYFGIIFAVLGMVSGFTAKKQEQLHQHFRNRTLTVLSIPTAISCVLIGICVLGKLPQEVTVVFILAMYFIQYIARGPFYTLNRRYLNNFTTYPVRTKIASFYYLIESIMRTVIALLASCLLRVTTSANTTLAIGMMITAIFLLLLNKMKTTVGLKPEAYRKEEIEFSEIK